MADGIERIHRHILGVRRLLDVFCEKLRIRGTFHDMSKLTSTVESEAFASEREDALGEALQHHYRSNKHHPECHADGVAGMTLVDLIEMLCDWKDSCDGRGNDDLLATMPAAKERFGIDDQLYAVLVNTVKNMWDGKR